MGRGSESEGAGRLAAALQLRWLGHDRARAYAAILFAVLALALVHYFREAMGPTGSDFLAFWSAGKLTAGGAAAAAYDPAAAGAVQASLGRSDVFAFVNPPPFLFAVLPLGLLTYPQAWIAWVMLGWTAWFLASRRLAPGLGWPVAAFPGAWLGATHAQLGLVCGALMAGFAALLGKRPFLAGLCLGALVIKPHLAVLVPFALLAGGQWRAIAGAAVASVGLVVLSWAAFGTETLLAYTHSWEVSRILMQDGSREFFLRQVTPYSQVRVHASPMAANAVQAVISLAAAGLTWIAWRRPGDLAGKVALVLALTPLATPYLFTYDLPFLVVPVIWLIVSAKNRGFGAWERPVLLLLYLSPLATRAAALPLGLNLMPAASALMAWLVWKEVWRARKDSNL